MALGVDDVCQGRFCKLHDGDKERQRNGRAVSTHLQRHGEPIQQSRTAFSGAWKSSLLTASFKLYVFTCFKPRGVKRINRPDVRFCARAFAQENHAIEQSTSSSTPFRFQTESCVRYAGGNSRPWRWESLPKVNSHADGRANGKMDPVMDFRISLNYLTWTFFSSISDARRAGLIIENKQPAGRVFFQGKKTFPNTGGGCSLSRVWVPVKWRLTPGLAINNTWLSASVFPYDY